VPTIIRLVENRNSLKSYEITRRKKCKTNCQTHAHNHKIKEVLQYDQNKRKIQITLDKRNQKK
jgi:hypothetical protein